MKRERKFCFYWLISYEYFIFMNLMLCLREADGMEALCFKFEFDQGKETWAVKFDIVLFIWIESWRSSINML